MRRLINSVSSAGAAKIVARRALVALALLGAASLTGCGTTARKAVAEDTIGRLKRDIAKVRFAIRTTKTLVARARGTKYLPDLYNRLSELYVEQARYHYQISYEKQKNRGTGVVSVQARLLKNQAIATYRRLLALFPKYPDADKVFFFMGHEMRELGDYENMLKTYQELADKYPKSEYRLEALLVMGDYYFDKAQLTQAETYYRKVLESAETRVHAMARYKLAWCRINRADFKGALKLFEGSINAARKWLAKSGGRAGGGSKIDLRREALVDSVFCFTEVHKPKGALDYFRKRADSKTTYLAALHKLGNRYYVKQNWPATATVYREILSMTGDVEDSLEYAHRLFEAVSNGKLYDHGAADVNGLIRVIRRRSYNHQLSKKDRTKLLDTFEKYARDISTRLQDAANSKQERDLYLAAAAAYKAYLSFFGKHKNATLVRSNLAETLYAAKRYLEAGRYYEEAAAAKRKGAKEAIYTAVVSYFEALKSKQKLTRLQIVEGRAGLRRAGTRYIRRFPRSDKARQVKFNVARTYYDAGEFDRAIRLFTALVNQFPTSKEAPISAHLVLDAYRSMEDYDGLIDAGKRFRSMAQLGGPEFKSEVAEIIKGAENALLRATTLEATNDESGDGDDKLGDIARKYGCTSLGKKAHLNRFVAARNSKDPEKVFEVGEEFFAKCPQAKELGDVLAQMGKMAVSSLQFYRGAKFLEAAAQRKSGGAALDLQKAAAEFRANLGQRTKAERSLGAVLRSGASADEKASLVVKIAQLHIQANDWNGMIGLLKRSMAAGASSAEMNYLLGYALYREGKLADAQGYLMAAVSAGKGGSADAKEAAAAAQFYLAEINFKTFEQIQLSSDLSKLGPSLQQKLGYLQQTQSAYTQVVALGSAVWSVAALGRLADVDRKAATALTSIALPSGLPPEVVKQVKAALDAKATPLEKEAKLAIKQCASTAKKFKVLSVAAKACLAGQAPQGDPQSSRPVPTISRKRPRGATKLQRILASRPTDLPTIIKLGKAYLRVGNPYLARMIFAKGIEVRETAQLQNLMGVATARLGEHQAALAIFGRAVKREPGLAAARLNRAALLGRYGYKADATAEAKRARKRRGLSEGDPELIPGALSAAGGS